MSSLKLRVSSLGYIKVYLVVVVYSRSLRCSFAETPVRRRQCHVKFLTQESNTSDTPKEGSFVVHDHCRLKGNTNPWSSNDSKFHGPKENAKSGRNQSRKEHVPSIEIE